MNDQEFRRSCLKRLIDELGHGGIARLARQLSIDASYVSRMLASIDTKQARPISGDMVLEITKHYPTWLRQSTETQKRYNKEPKNLMALPIGHLRRVPLIDWTDLGNWIMQSLKVDDFPQLPCPVEVGPKAYALRVRGISMSPRFEDGQIIFVDPEAKPVNARAVVVLFEGDTEATLGRLAIEGEKSFLILVNPDWPFPKVLPITETTTYCGLVIGKWVPD